MSEKSDELVFENELDYRNWAKSQDWYQSINLKCGIKTQGKFPTDKRLEGLSVDFQSKTVLDVGCNSGQYSLLARQMGASRVVGIDPNPMRIKQARILSANEDLPVEFIETGIESIPSLGGFDIIICIAVLTEIENVIGGLRLLREAILQEAFIEMGISKPLFYLSRNKKWWSGKDVISRLGQVGEFRRHKHAGWVIYPTLEIIQDIFGPSFQVENKGPGLRYDMLHVKKII